MATCAIDGCSVELVTATLCPTHYRADKRRNDPVFNEKDRAARRKHYAKHREQIKVEQSEYRERNREEKNAYMKRYRSDPDVATKQKAATRRWQKKNKAYVNATVTARNLRKKKVTVLPFSPDGIQGRVEMFGSLCWICGDPYRDLDHTKPLAAGGLHTPSNLRPACQRCNTAKHANWPVDTTTRRLDPARLP